MAAMRDTCERVESMLVRLWPAYPATGSALLPWNNASVKLREEDFQI